MSYRHYIQGQLNANRVDFAKYERCDACVRRFHRDELITDRFGSRYCEDCSDDVGHRHFTRKGY